ncbi:MAG TPA: hypothetical protein VLT33_30940 [Labilithrix sp.]|nr:hypothetical protein [Labilithrix sp.]
MKGIDLVARLEAEGFTVSRRSKSLVWLVRGGAEQLLVDSETEVEEELAQDILARARHAKKP